MLLEKLTHIMKSRREASCSLNAPISVNCCSKSLNKVIRKQQLRKIVNENQSLLKRLQMNKSHYDVDQWNKEYMYRTKMLFNICEYPYKLACDGTKQLPSIQIGRASCRERVASPV